MLARWTPARASSQFLQRSRAERVALIQLRESRLRQLDQLLCELDAARGLALQRCAAHALMVARLRVVRGLRGELRSVRFGLGARGSVRPAIPERHADVDAQPIHREDVRSLALHAGLRLGAQDRRERVIVNARRGLRRFALLLQRDE